MRISEKPFNFYFLVKSLKCGIKSFYSDQAFWDFQILVALFPLSVKKRLVYKSFEFSGIKKENDKKFQL